MSTINLILKIITDGREVTVDKDTLLLFAQDKSKPYILLEKNPDGTGDIIVIDFAKVPDNIKIVTVDDFLQHSDLNLEEGNLKIENSSLQITMIFRQFEGAVINEVDAVEVNYFIMNLVQQTSNSNIGETNTDATDSTETNTSLDFEPTELYTISFSPIRDNEITFKVLTSEPIPVEPRTIAPPILIPSPTTSTPSPPVPPPSSPSEPFVNLLLSNDVITGDSGNNILYMDGNYQSLNSMPGANLIGWFEVQDSFGYNNSAISFSDLCGDLSVEYDLLVNKAGGQFITPLNTIMNDVSDVFARLGDYSNNSLQQFDLNNSVNFLPAEHLNPQSNHPDSLRTANGEATDTQTYKMSIDFSGSSETLQMNSHDFQIITNNNFSIAIVWQAESTNDNLTRVMYEQADSGTGNENISIIVNNSQYGISINGADYMLGTFTDRAINASVFSVASDGTISLYDNNGTANTTFNPANLVINNDSDTSIGSSVTNDNFFGRSDNTKADIFEIAIYDDNFDTQNQEILYSMMRNKYAFHTDTTIISAADKVFLSDTLIDGFDSATGGAGSDIFYFSDVSFSQGSNSSGGNPDRITDFNAAEGDKIWLDFTYSITTFDLDDSLYSSSAQLSWEAQGSDTLITIGWNHQLNSISSTFIEAVPAFELLLEGVNASNISRDDFIFNNLNDIYGANLNTPVTINNETINGSDTDNVLKLAGNNLNINAGDGNDIVALDSISTSNNSKLFGGAGNDVLLTHNTFGFAGGTISANYALHGEAGDDYIYYGGLDYFAANIGGAIVPASGEEHGIYLGGTGTDTLLIGESGIRTTVTDFDLLNLDGIAGLTADLSTLDLTTLTETYVDGFEEITFGVYDGNTITNLDSANLLALTDPGINELFITTDGVKATGIFAFGPNTVDLSGLGWNSIADTMANGVNYKTFTDVGATLYIQDSTDITIVGP